MLGESSDTVPSYFAILLYALAPEGMWESHKVRKLEDKEGGPGKAAWQGSEPKISSRVHREPVLGSQKKPHRAVGVYLRDRAYKQSLCA